MLIFVGKGNYEGKMNCGRKTLRAYSDIIMYDFCDRKLKKIFTKNKKFFLQIYAFV